MDIHGWLKRHSLRLLAILDTPNAIAGGVAIGIFFGFTPLFGLKTLGAIFFAWLTRSNILAAVLAVTLHDIIGPLMLVIYGLEHRVGYWLLSSPHRWPPPLLKAPYEGHTLRSWATIFKVGKDLLLGSIVCAVPFSLLSFFITRSIVARHHRKRDGEGRKLDGDSQRQE